MSDQLVYCIYREKTLVAVIEPDREECFPLSIKDASSRSHVFYMNESKAVMNALASVSRSEQLEPNFEARGFSVLKTPRSALEKIGLLDRPQLKTPELSLGWK